jgi:uncharacterized membrane protein YeiH
MLRAADDWVGISSGALRDMLLRPLPVFWVGKPTHLLASIGAAWVARFIGKPDTSPAFAGPCFS